MRVQDFAQLNGTVIAVGGSLKAPGTDGGILISANPTWIRTLGVQEDLYAADVYRNEFVAVGRGTILTSLDGTNWARAKTDFTNTLRSVVSTENRVIAVGHGGIITTSQDGHTWSTQIVGPYDWTGIAYGNGRYVICGLESLGLSDDGQNWRLVPGFAQSALFDGNLFRINRSSLAGGWTASSVDGENWGGASLAWGVHKIAQGPTGFVGIGVAGRVEWYGVDGYAFQSEWSSFAEWDAVRYLNGEFYVGGEKGRIFKGQPELQ